MVLNLGSIEPHGFIESVSVTLICSKYSLSYGFLCEKFMFFLCVKFMFCWFCSLNTVILCAWFILCTNKIYTYVLKKSYFIFPITKGLVNALMKLAGFSTSSKVKNHCYRPT